MRYLLVATMLTFGMTVDSFSAEMVKLDLVTGRSRDSYEEARLNALRIAVMNVMPTVSTGHTVLKKSSRTSTKYIDGKSSFIKDTEKTLEQIVREDFRGVVDSAREIRSYIDGEWYIVEIEAVVLDTREEDKEEDRVFYSAGSIEEFEGYIAKYPKGRYISEANSKVESIIHEHAVNPENQEQSKYINMYLRKYPHGKYISEVKMAFEHGVFIRATTIKGCHSYLNKAGYFFPKIDHRYNQIQLRLQELEANEIGTLAECDEWFSKYGEDAMFALKVENMRETISYKEIERTSKDADDIQKRMTHYGTSMSGYYYNELRNKLKEERMKLIGLVEIFQRTYPNSKYNLVIQEMATKHARAAGVLNKVRLGARLSSRSSYVSSHENTSSNRSSHWPIIEGTWRSSRGDSIHISQDGRNILAKSSVSNRIRWTGKGTISTTGKVYLSIQYSRTRRFSKLFGQLRENEQKIVNDYYKTPKTFPWSR